MTHGRFSLLNRKFMNKQAVLYPVQDPFFNVCIQKTKTLFKRTGQHLFLNHHSCHLSSVCPNVR